PPTAPISTLSLHDALPIYYSATVYNGIDIDAYTLEEEAEDYLMFSGRITPEKGVREAVQVAMQSGRRLLIAGSLSKKNYWYFDRSEEHTSELQSRENLVCR